MKTVDELLQERAQRPEPEISPAMRKFYSQQALANVMIEGFEPTEEDWALIQRYENAEISGEEMLRIVVEREKKAGEKEHLPK